MVDGKLLEAASNPVAMNPFSATTTNRRRRVESILRLLLPVVREPSEIIGCLYQVFSVTTAMAYATTMAAIRPRLKTPQWETAMLWLQQQLAKARFAKKQARLSIREAVPIEVEAMKKLLGRATARQKAAWVAMWVSASRHGDLSKMEQVHTFAWPASPHPGTVAIRYALPVWKSDPNGRRMAMKCLVMPKNMQVRRTTYREMYAKIKAIDNKLTLHSIRRGAIRYLVQQGVPAEEIVLLTQHSQGVMEQRQLRVYLPRDAKSTEVVTQIRLGWLLLQALLPQLRI